MPRIFALGLVLPFTHINRLILAGLVPAALIGCFLLTSFGRSAIDWLSFFVELSQGLTPEPRGSAAAVAWSSLFLILVLALWLCAWQRNTVHVVAEPVGHWLLRSLLRFPGYVVALVLWLIAPFIITLPGTFLVGWALERGLENARYGMPNGLGINPGMLTPVQWWVAGIGTLTFALLGLWFSARLSPLPAVVSAQGWRGSLGKAWRTSTGHGFGLSVSLFACSLIGSVLAAILYIGLFASTMSADLRTDLPLTVLMAVQSASIASLAMSALVMLWHTSIAALLVRESAALDDPLDPAMFD